MDAKTHNNNIIMDKTCRPGPSKLCDPISSSVRLQRNQAEKQRRDRLNSYISELAALVPMVKNSSKPVDKVSILRLAAAHMRLNISCLDPKHFKSKFSTLPSSITSHLEMLEKNIGGFIVVTTFAGVVIFCSKSVEDFVGYQNIDFMGQSIYNFVHNKEVMFLEKKLGAVISRYKEGNLKKAAKLIRLHLQKRPLPRTNDLSYQKMLFKISVHSNESHDEQNKNAKIPTKGKKLMKHKDFGTSAVILMFVEPVKIDPKINLSYLLTHQDIYFTIHGLQGEIMHADHRISTITGYMPRDVLGTSAYKYIFETDVPIALFAQREMFTSNDGVGLITYRLKTFNSRYIYLQSKGRIVFKDSSSEISHFMCYNKWLSDEEGEKELKKFHERYSPQSTAAAAADAQKHNPDSNMLTIEPPKEKLPLNGSTSGPQLSPLVQNVPGYQNGFKEDSHLCIFHPSDVRNNSSDRGHLGVNLINYGNSYSSSQQQFLKVKNSEESNISAMSHSRVNDYNSISNHDKTEQMEISSFDETNDCIIDKHFPQHQSSVCASPPSLNYHENTRDFGLFQYPECNRENSNGNTSNHFYSKNESLDHGGIQSEKGFPSTFYTGRNARPNIKACYTNVQHLDSYDPYTGIQTNGFSTGKSLTCLIDQEPTVNSATNIENLFRAQISLCKVPENNMLGDVNMSNDLQNLDSLNAPSINSNSYYVHNNKPVGTSDVGYNYENNLYQVRISEKCAHHNTPLPKFNFYGTEYPCNDVGKFCDDVLYRKGASNYGEFGFQRVNNPQYPEFSKTTNSTELGDLNFSVPTQRVKLDDICDSKHPSDSVVPLGKNRDVTFQNRFIEPFPEILTDKGRLGAPELNQSCVSTTTQKSTVDVGANQELYNELDMFFKNLPSPTSAQNEYSFKHRKSSEFHSVNYSDP